MKTENTTFDYRDTIATVLVALIIAPYIGYLVNGSVPFVQDPRDMAALGLVLGLVAAVVLGRPAFSGGILGRAAVLAGVGSAALGFGTLIWAEEGTFSEVLLAIFIGSIVLTWTLAILVDTGALHSGRSHPVKW